MASVTRAIPTKISPRRRARPEARRKDGLLTTGDMARMSHNTLRTVRFYEEVGLLVPLHRTGGGHRLFPMRELRKLLLVTDLRAAGFALEEIRDMLELKGRARSGAGASRDVLARIQEHTSMMSTRITLLKRVLVELDATKQRLLACTACEDRKLFPGSCGDCPAMKSAESLPDALGVLWGIDT